jgi:ribonuclease R
LAKRPSKKQPLPSKSQLVEYIKQSPDTPSRRDIARAFGIRGPDRAWLRQVLWELEDDGLVIRHRGKRVGAVDRLPPVAVLEVALVDDDGDALCKPVAEEEAAAAGDAIIRLVQKRGRAPDIGDRVLARLQRLDEGEYEAKPIRFLAAKPHAFLGVYEASGNGGAVRSVDRRAKLHYRVTASNRGDAGDGDYVRAEPIAGRHREAKIVERIGGGNDASSFSLLALMAQEIPIEFPDDALAEADKLKPPALGTRTDLRKIPLVTIDGPDARDFDDAVWAEPDGNPKNKGGWHAIVAIADVAHYVKPGSALDRAAQTRGNSVYFPDRVVPMLPEVLSNGLCSLRPNEERACMAAHLWIDTDGRLTGWRFERGLMRSAARLTYDQVQQAQDGKADDTTGPLLDTVIAPLYAVYDTLQKARLTRGTLDLDLPERQVLLGNDGHIRAIVPRARLDSHKLIEELMIAANVAAAETLHKTKLPAMRRIHEPPDAESLEALRQSLQSFGLNLARGAVVRPSVFAGILKKAAGTDYAELVSDLVLRSQMQAYYGPADSGHFGLALRRYCHFTSPIRRYSDILVHRALIDACKLGKDGLGDADIDRFDHIAEHISATERKAAQAERNAMDRYTTAFLAEKIGAQFAARITGVTRYGLFVRLHETGADGLVPMRALPDDWYEHDEVRHCLVGRSTGLTYTLGEPVTVELMDADIATGSMSFTIIDGGKISRKTTAGKGKRRTGKSGIPKTKAKGRKPAGKSKSKSRPSPKAKARRKRSR